MQNGFFQKRKNKYLQISQPDYAERTVKKQWATIIDYELQHQKIVILKDTG